MGGTEYDEQAIKNSVLDVWERGEFFVLPYFSKRSGRNNEVTNFILDFKNGWATAAKLASELVIDSLAGVENTMREILKCRCIVAAPPSSKGRARPTSESMCKAVADRFDWLTHLPGALERIKAVKKSAFAGPGNRPTYQDHIDSIKWSGPPCDLRGKGVILFDDVYTRGETSSACRTIIIEATRCSKVVGVFLGRTQ